MKLLAIDIRPLSDEYVRGEVRILTPSKKHRDAVARVFAKACLDAFEVLTGKPAPVTVNQWLAEQDAVNAENAKKDARIARGAVGYEFVE